MSPQILSQTNLTMTPKCDQTILSDWISNLTITSLMVLFFQRLSTHTRAARLQASSRWRADTASGPAWACSGPSRGWGSGRSRSPTTVILPGEWALTNQTWPISLLNGVIDQPEKSICFVDPPRKSWYLLTNNRNTVNISNQNQSEHRKVWDYFNLILGVINCGEQYFTNIPSITLP